MALNNKEISLILEELKLTGYWIQKITQPNYASLVLHLYKNASLHLYINLACGEERFHSIKQKLPKEEKMMRFVQLLRSRILGAKIEDACQIDENRIVLLKLKKQDVEYHFYIKLWSNATNIILADSDDVIIDVFFRREKKGEVAKKVFSLPEAKQVSKVFSVREYDRSLSFNEAIEKEYSEGGRTLSIEAVQKRCEKFFLTKIEKLEKLIEKLKRQAREFAHCERYKHAGDLITSNIHLIKKGDCNACVFDYIENKEIKISLDALKSPQENAQSYYAQYKREISGIEKINEDIKEKEEIIETLKKTCTLIMEEKDATRMSRLLEKEESKDIQVHLHANEEKTVGLRFVVEGWHILVGRSSKENDELLRHYAKGGDTWLHTRDVPGGYVFIKTKGKDKSVPKNVLIAAGNLAVFYSKARISGKADLYKTQAKNLRRAKGAPIGTVLPYHEKNLHIKLDYELLENLKKCKKDISN